VIVDTFSVDHLPGDPAQWPKYRKKSLASAIRIEGAFEVVTSEGMLRCQDGYLAVDARGYPYPIAKDEFELIYDLVNEDPGSKEALGEKAGERGMGRGDVS